MLLRIKLIVLLFYITGFCFSQNYTTRLFAKDQGLLDPYVYSVIQDQQGFLWISTGKGLTKFDGQFFLPINSKLLANDPIYASAIQSNGDLWFGTSTGKLYTLKTNSKELDSFQASAKASINKIVVSAYQDELYVNTVGNGVFIKKKDALIQIPITLDYQVNAMEELSKNILLLATNDGLFTLDLRSQKIIKIKLLEEGIKGIQKLKRNKNSFCILTEQSHFYDVELSLTGLPVSVKLLGTFKEGLVKDITAFTLSYDGNELYSGSLNEQLTINALDEDKIQILDETNFMAVANSFFEDSEKNMWVATTGKGLYRISKASYDLIGLNEQTYSIAQIGTTFFYGTKDGLKIYDRDNVFNKHVTKIENIALGKITALYFDQKNLWIGTETEGLFVVIPETFSREKLDFSEIEGLAVNSITGFGETTLVTTNLDGVYNYKNGKLQNHFSVQNSLLHNNVYYALASRSAKIYYATHKTAFNYSEGDKLYEIDIKDLGLISDFNCFAENKFGQLFIATNGDGLYVMRNKTIHPFEFNENLTSKFCDGVLMDDENNLWIAQRYHLYKYYTKENVLREIKFDQSEQTMLNANAFYKAQGGDLYFGTNKGVLVVNAHQDREKLIRPYLVSLRVQDSLKEANRRNAYFSNGTYHFVMEFSGQGLKNSEDVLFKYKLEGRDENWSELSKVRKAEFSKLGEGTYIFKVMAYNSEGFSSGEVTLFEFTIAAPYWKNAIFWTAIVFVLGTVIVLIIKSRTAKLVRDKKNLEILIAEKTKELREEKEIVEKNNVLIKEQNLEIKDSIMYAKRIQDALLPNKEVLTAGDKNMFILYQPRDIVSGDFFWSAEIENLKIIVVADCTGHGVPGALMSMIGATLLNKIILERKITQPKIILEELDKEIKLALKQHTEEATRDGMDVSICCVNSTEKKIIYAGAMRPLFFVRGRQFTEYPANKYAIGGYNYDKEKVFEETEITTQVGDMIYLFSDGYADQFGGEKGKKLMVKNFKKILVSISEMELFKQEENLKRVYNNWKGGLDQVDDVLVIGLKI